MFLNKASQFGLYAVVTMARQPGQRVSAGSIARSFNISENHVAKVLQQLARAGLINSVRGVGGGYQLVNDPAEVTMLDIIECLDGPLRDACSSCALVNTLRCHEPSAACSVHNVLAELNQTAYFTFKSITLATLAKEDNKKNASVA